MCVNACVHVCGVCMSESVRGMSVNACVCGVCGVCMSVCVVCECMRACGGVWCVWCVCECV